MPTDHADTRDRLARIERMIEHYRLAKKCRLQRRAITLWRKLEAQRWLGTEHDKLTYFLELLRSCAPRWQRCLGNPSGTFLHVG